MSLAQGQSLKHLARGCWVSDVQDERYAWAPLTRVPLIDLPIQVKLCSLSHLCRQDGTCCCDVDAGDQRAYGKNFRVRVMLFRLTGAKSGRVCHPPIQG
jgi:hypothetical protein